MKLMVNTLGARPREADTRRTPRARRSRVETGRTHSANSSQTPAPDDFTRASQALCEVLVELNCRLKTAITYEFSKALHVLQKEMES